MPLTTLFCEGGPSSPDARVLSKLLSGLCKIDPVGSKHGMGQKILAKRETPQHKNTVAGILDGDFLKEWKPPEGKPQVWQISENHRIFTLGWRWERIEIENYLVDPIVIEKTIGKDRIDLIQYKQALEQARNDIAAYQAARTALSANRRRLKILKSCFGSERGKEKHHFPNDLSTPSCEEGIKNTVASHREEQFINEKDVIESFGHYRKECLPDGIRYQHYLHTFSGKDLFWAMDGWLRKNRFQGASEFREKILIGIRNTTDDIATWIQEWGEFKKMTQV